jgi:hypothetical protein
MCACYYSVLKGKVGEVMRRKVRKLAVATSGEKIA